MYREINNNNNNNMFMTVVMSKYYSGYQIKKKELGRVCGMYEKLEI